jgi:hypothetical protein
LQQTCASSAMRATVSLFQSAANQRLDDRPRAHWSNQFDAHLMFPALASVVTEWGR